MPPPPSTLVCTYQFQIHSKMEQKGSKVFRLTAPTVNALYQSTSFAIIDSLFFLSRQFLWIASLVPTCDPPASTSQALSFQACTATPSQNYFLKNEKAKRLAPRTAGRMLTAQWLWVYLKVLPRHLASCFPGPLLGEKSWLRDRMKG